MNIYLAFVVILVTVGVAFRLGWIFNRGAAELDRIQLLDQLDEVTDKLLDRAMDDMQLPRAGHLDPMWDGETLGELAPPQSYAPVPWDLAGAAYALGQQRADQDAVSREVNAIFAEIEHNPERWQR